MADHTRIEWADATWSPIVGCSVISPGCTNCYAMRLAGGRLRKHPSRAGLTTPSKAGPVWNGEVRLYDPAFNADFLFSPRGRRVFVCAHGDLFHEAVPDEWIDLVHAVMIDKPQHTYLVLTKRSARMREYYSDAGKRGDQWCLRLSELRNGDPGEAPDWPLPNLWLGVSVEDQARADERIPELLATPAAKRFISAEPLIGPVDLRGWETHDWRPADPGETVPRLDWVICGGESGPGARPSHPEWFRALRDQCAAGGVPFFFKQWGEWDADTLLYTDPEGECPPPNMRVGKKRAGRQLDGHEYNEMPMIEGAANG